jgi:VWFA-related protein
VRLGLLCSYSFRVFAFALSTALSQLAPSLEDLAMRKWALYVILAGIALPASAATRITVDQLQNLLAAARTKSDVDLARQISGLELTERLNAAASARLEASLPGASSRQALVALADASAFLAPPASEIPAQPAPDVAEQRRMLALTVSYVAKTIPLLPNFFATRDTNRFEDTPQVQGAAGFIPFQPLHHVGAASVTILFRDGREAIDTGASNKPPPRTEGLVTIGAFGPMLGTVLMDAAQNKMAWSHWELGSSGPEAVFSYAVPKEKSHYEVNYCCVADEASGVAANMHPFRRVVGYHGEITLDPTTGTILRLVSIAELKTPDPVVKAAILVEYAPVQIGGRTYFCPVKNITIAQAQTVQLDPTYKYPLANQIQPLKNSLNDTAFVQYHLFRADAQILPEAVADQSPAPNLPSGNGSSAPAASMSAPPQPAETETTSAAAPAPTATAEPARPEPSKPQPAQPEISVAAVASLPNAPAKSQPTLPQSSFTLRTTARLVDVGVVAYDKKGHPVTDLKSSDFEIYDGGRKQRVHFFSQAGTAEPKPEPGQPATASAQTAGADSQPLFSNRRAAAPTAAQTSAGNVTILLLDGSNMAFGDLTYAREEALRFLQSLAPGERVALYTMTRIGFQILTEDTADHTAVAARLRNWTPAAQDVATAQDEEGRNRSRMETVRTPEDMLNVNGNTSIDPMLNAEALDPKLRDFGSDPANLALSILVGVARHLPALPGHKSLVWITSDDVLADWSNSSVTVEKDARYIEPFALHAQEAMNDAHVSVYALDASQLEAGVTDAGIGRRNVELSPVTGEIAAMTDKWRGPELNAGADVRPYDQGTDQRPGRLTAQMKQDLRPIQGAFREVAEATGGRVFRRSGSIAVELNGVVNDGRAAYLLSFTPDQPADNKYHPLIVKIPGRSDITLRYRTGYQYDQEPSTLKMG